MKSWDNKKIAHSLSKLKAGLGTVALKYSLHFPFLSNRTQNILSTAFCADYTDSDYRNPWNFIPTVLPFPTLERKPPLVWKKWSSANSLPEWKVISPRASLLFTALNLPLATWCHSWGNRLGSFITVPGWFAQFAPFSKVKGLSRKGYILSYSYSYSKAGAL